MRAGFEALGLGVLDFFEDFEDFEDFGMKNPCLTYGYFNISRKGSQVSAFDGVKTELDFGRNKWVFRGV